MFCSADSREQGLPLAERWLACGRPQKFKRLPTALPQPTQTHLSSFLAHFFPPSAPNLPSITLDCFSSSQSTLAPYHTSSSLLIPASITYVCSCSLVLLWLVKSIADGMQAFVSDPRSLCSLNPHISHNLSSSVLLTKRAGPHHGHRNKDRGSLRVD